MTWWGNRGPLMAQWKILGPLMTQWGNWEPLIKQWGNCVGKLNDLMGKTENWALDGAMEHLGHFGDAIGKLETLAMGKMGPPDDLMGKLGALDHELFLNGLIRDQLHWRWHDWLLIFRRRCGRTPQENEAGQVTRPWRHPSAGTFKLCWRVGYTIVHHL